MNQDNVIFAISILVLAVLAGLWVRKRVKLSRARSWPVQSGKVESTELKLEQRGNNQSMWVARVNYSYGVDAASYSGVLRRQFLLKGRADKWVETFPGGLPLKVRCNPEKPSDSVVFEDEQAVAKVG